MGKSKGVDYGMVWAHLRQSRLSTNKCKAPVAEPENDLKGDKSSY